MFQKTDNPAGLLPGSLGVMFFQENARRPEGWAGPTEFVSLHNNGLTGSDKRNI